ncbi:hypothetical protein FISHEDRAFT_30587, partial [Fistulina hepatica ATCC 64428]
GYLLSAFAAQRDRFEYDGRVIISHGGGHAESIHSHGGRKELLGPTDQTERDKSVTALLNTYAEHLPIALVIDDSYALFPFDLSSRSAAYAVLGWYTIVAVWAERQPADNESGYLVRFKFAFRWYEDK